MLGFLGAGDRIRTGDILLGKQTLCQLSYTRISVVPEYSKPVRGRKPRSRHQHEVRDHRVVVRGELRIFVPDHRATTHEEPVIHVDGVNA